MRPPRLMWRDMARRAASSWRAVRRPRAIAFRPYSPKDTLLPRVAMPVLRPFCCLRYLVRAGCSMAYSFFSPPPAPWRRTHRILDDFLGALDGGLRRAAAGSAFLARLLLAFRTSAWRARAWRRPWARASWRAWARRGASGLRRRGAAVGGQRGLRLALGHHFALVDPDLDADHAVAGLRLAHAVVDVGAQRVQRHAAFAVPLGARDLDAVQAARRS